MYFFVFFTFCFCFVFSEICGRQFLKHNNENKLISAIVKISIFIWTLWKNSICIDFVHKITFWSHFRSDGHVHYVTSEPYPRAWQIWCQNVQETWKKKVIKCRGESFARCRVIARNVEITPVFLGLKEFRLAYAGCDHQRLKYELQWKLVIKRSDIIKYLIYKVFSNPMK